MLNRELEVREALVRRGLLELRRPRELTTAHPLVQARAGSAAGVVRRNPLVQAGARCGGAARRAAGHRQTEVLARGGTQRTSDPSAEVSK